MNALAHLDPVGLDEIVAEAALLTRVDRKYVVPRAALEHVLGGLADGTRVLEIDGERRFVYESMYFDTPDLLSFHMAAQPRRRRFKLRTRAYVDTGAAYLEMKTRGARGATVKERDAYDITRRDELTVDARADVADAFPTIGVAPDRADDLDAVLKTGYRRTTLLAPDGASRATVDTDLTWLGADGSGFLLPGLAIVETKSGARASDVDRLLWRAGLRPAIVSKYATGLAALRPDLPRNRWARLLRGAFAETERAALPQSAAPGIRPTYSPTTSPRTEEEPCSPAA